MKKLIKMKFGSHLYGLNTPSSDMDYKGIFIPDLDDLLLARIKHNDNHSTSSVKNTADDVDTEWISLHKFIHDAVNGQTYAFDMLHAPDNMIVESDVHTKWIWEELQMNREKFYSKNIHAFTGYCKQQATKYGLRGTRIKECKMFLNWLDTFDPDSKLSENDYSTYPKGKYIKFIPWQNIEQKHPDQQRIDTFQVCEKQFQVSVVVGYAKMIILTYMSNYGERAKKAEANNGVDWKAVSHAFRVIGEAKQIALENTITFPLDDRDFILDVKLGKYTMEELSPMLDKRLDDVEAYFINSNLPERPDKQFWDKWLLKTLKTFYL